jgi:hypothetical protein
MFERSKIIGFIKEVLGYIILISLIDFVLKKYSYLDATSRTIYEVFFAVLLMLVIQEVIRRYKK